MISTDSGEKYYKRELAIASSRILPIAVGGDGINRDLAPEKRRTSPLPVFHGNLETSQILDLRPNFFYDAGSNSLKFGSETHLLSERTQPAVIIELPESERLDISSLFTELYLKGLSLREIEQQTGAAKSVIRRRLLTNGVKLRSHIAVPFSSKKKVIGKSNIRPPYGFCYFQGQIVLDQKEYRNLLLIYKLWKSNANPNRISELLNEKNIPPRIAKFWNRNSVISILTRFENKQIVSKGGQLELR